MRDVGASTFLPSRFSLKNTNAIIPAIAKVIAYTKKGARKEIADRIPPKAGPVMLPSKKPPLKRDCARPRISSVTERIKREPADTENIEEPRPPRDLKMSI